VRHQMPKSPTMLRTDTDATRQGIPHQVGFDTRSLLRWYHMGIEIHATGLVSPGPRFRDFRRPYEYRGTGRSNAVLDAYWRADQP